VGTFGPDATVLGIAVRPWLEGAATNWLTSARPAGDGFRVAADALEQRKGLGGSHPALPVGRRSDVL
jgi:hypothetical protein